MQTGGPGRESNPRPTHCKCAALPTELPAQNWGDRRDLNPDRRAHNPAFYLLNYRHHKLAGVAGPSIAAAPKSFLISSTSWQPFVSDRVYSFAIPPKIGAVRRESNPPRQFIRPPLSLVSYATAKIGCRDQESNLGLQLMRLASYHYSIPQNVGSPFPLYLGFALDAAQNPGRTKVLPGFRSRRMRSGFELRSQMGCLLDPPSR